MAKEVDDIGALLGLPDELLVSLLTFFDAVSLARCSCCCVTIYRASLATPDPWCSAFGSLVDANASLPAESCEASVWRAKAIAAKMLQQGRGAPPRHCGFLPRKFFLQGRSGHSISFLPEFGILVLFGGATVGYRFRNDVDLVFAGDGALHKVGVCGTSFEAGCPVPPRWLHTAVVVPGTSILCIYGGLLQSSLPSHDLHLLWLEPRGESFKVVARPHAISSTNTVDAQKRGGHSAVMVQTQENLAMMVIFGGLVAPQQPTSRVSTLTLPTGLDVEGKPHILQPDARLEWAEVTTSGTAPEPRWCHSALVTGNDSMVTFGGWGVGTPQTRFLNDVHVLDTTTWTWSTPRVFGVPPSPRCQCCCFAPPTGSEVGNWMYLFGGANHAETAGSDVPYGDRVVDLSDLRVLDMDCFAWVPVHPNFGYAPLRGGVNAGVGLGEGRAIITGGMNSDSGSDEPNFLSDVVELKLPGLG